jgi:hypothetical protein
MKGVEVTSVVLCDEVRREVAGSAIIIGAKPSGPPVADDKITHLLRLALYIELEVPFPAPKKVAFRLRDTKMDYNVLEHSFELPEMDDSEETEGDFDLRGVVVCVLNEDNVEIRGSGILEVQIKYDRSKWSKVREFVFPTV